MPKFWVHSPQLQLITIICTYLIIGILVQLKEMQQENPLKNEWIDSTEQAIDGKNGSYKLIKSKFLGRGGFGIVFVALRKYKEEEKDKYEEVVIKQFKKSQKWKKEEDWDKELVILSKFSKEWNQKYILQVIDIFQAKALGRHYLVTRYASDGTLTERIKSQMKESEINAFAVRSAQILHYLHYQALKDYKSTEKDKGQNKMGIIHRDFKPANLVFVQKEDLNTMFLIDFGIAKIGYTDVPSNYSNCGTNNYKAPQIAQKNLYDTKVDIYSFGCTLYEVIAGQRLLGSAGINTLRTDRSAFVKFKLEELEYRMAMMGPEKYKNVYRWIQILSFCLQTDPANRWNSVQLLDYLNRSNINELSTKRFLNEPSKPLDDLRLKKQVFQLNFEIYRTNIIQDIVFQIFEFLYFEQPKISKFVVYCIIKYMIFFVIDKFNKIKQRSRLIKNNDKITLVKRLIDDKKIEQIRKKAHQKIVEELSKEKEVKSNQELGPVEDIITRFPQILKENAPEPRRIFFQFCFQTKDEILKYQKFSDMVVQAVQFMNDIDSYPQIKVEWKDLKDNVEGLSLKKLYKLKQILQVKMRQKGSKQNILEQCQVEMSVRSGINREEQKTEIPIVKRK